MSFDFQRQMWSQSLKVLRPVCTPVNKDAQLDEGFHNDHIALVD